MAYDLAPLRSYVRFYLSVVDQLHAAWATLGDSHETVREAVSPYVEAFAALSNAALGTASSSAPAPPSGLSKLWRPADVEGLSGLVDVYEVVGRFTFQGNDDENLGRVQELVSAARNEIYAQRARLTDLLQLAPAARAAAEKANEAEARAAGERRRERDAAFDQLAQQVIARAKQTADAVRAVPPPRVDDIGSAADEYARYMVKANKVYQTCLPFLHKALASLYAFVGADEPASWPDVLPFAPEIPAELLTAPAADSPELARARASLADLEREGMALVRARDESLVLVARLEADRAAMDGEGAAAQRGAALAGELLAWATAHAGLAEGADAVASLEQQKAEREHAAGAFREQYQRTVARASALEQEAAACRAAVERGGEALAAERQREPVLFGKEDWRLRVAALDHELGALRASHAQHVAALNQLKVEISSLSVRVQTEQRQADLVERWRLDAVAKFDARRVEVEAAAARLGPARPPQVPGVDEARARHAQAVARGEALGARRERAEAELARRRDDVSLVVARLKQIGVDRQRVEGVLQNAEQVATEGREATLRQLAARRAAAVSSHVADVVDGLDRSLQAAEVIFVAPAREAAGREGDEARGASRALAAAAEGFASVAEALARDVEPDLLAQDALLGQVQREFCDAAPAACRAAWG